MKSASTRHGDRAVSARRRRARATIRRRRLTLALVFLALLILAVKLASGGSTAPKLTPLEARVVALATGQLGYKTDPADTYCNRFSAYWHAGALDCANSNRDEQWCADFAAWVWHKAGVQFVYGQGPDDINAGSVSFYLWGLAHHLWHPVSSQYTPHPGDVAVYGLDLATMSAQHVAVVTSWASGSRGPNVVNGDGERTGFSVVETGTDQYKADLNSNGGQLAGYVSPPPLPLSQAREH